MWCEELKLNCCIKCKQDTYPHSRNGMCSMCYQHFNNLDKDEQKKELRRIRQRIYYMQNPDKYKQKNKVSHERHKDIRNLKRRLDRQQNLEEYRLKDKLRYERDREKRCEQSRKFRKENPEKVAEWNRCWYEANKDYIIKYKANYYKVNLDNIKEKKKIYYRNNKEIITLRNKAYYENNKESLLKKKKIYYQENREEILLKNKEYREKNREKYIEYLRKYYRENKETLLKKQQERIRSNPEYYREIARRYRIKNNEIISIKDKERYQKNRVTILQKLRLHNYIKRQASLDDEKDDDRLHKKINTQYEKTPEVFRDLLLKYINYTFEIRDMQIKRGAINFLSNDTIYLYCIYLRKFLEWIYNKNIHFISIVSKEQIQEYIDLNYYTYSTIRNFFTFCVKKHLVLHNASNYVKKGGKVESSFPDTLDEKKQFYLYNYAYSNDCSPDIGLTIVLSLIHGLTSDQIRQIKMQDIDFSKKVININETSSKSHKVILDSDDYKVLKAYLEFRDELIDLIPPPDYLYVTYNSILSNKPIAFNTLSKIIKRVDSNLTIGIIRNTWLKNFVHFCGDIRLAAEAAGYNSVYLAKKSVDLGLNL